MSCHVHITKAAERDLEGAADYVEYVLLNPASADNLLEAFEDLLKDLRECPELYTLSADPVLFDWGIRFAPVKNYLVFYTLLKEDAMMYILRFLYGKRNWGAILKQGISFD